MATKNFERSAYDKLKSFYIHLGIYLIVNIGLAVLNFRRNPENLWFAWVAMGWGIGVLCHGLKVMGVIGNRRIGSDS